MRVEFIGWKAFRYRGKQFLSLDMGHGVKVVGEDMSNYGGFYSIDSFKRHYAAEGERLAICKGEG